MWKSIQQLFGFRSDLSNEIKWQCRIIMLLIDKYSRILRWSDEDSCYIVTIPEFPHLLAFGYTIEEALKECQFALNGFIQVYEESEIPIPNPTLYDDL